MRNGSLFKVISNVHIYAFQIDEYKGDIKRFFSSLSTDERERHDTLTSRKLKRRYTVFRGLLRQRLSEFTGIEASKIRFEYNRYGKPRIAKRQNQKDIRFNISHCGDYGLIGITKGREIGVDLEIIKPLAGMCDIASRFYPPNEFEKFNKIADGDKKRAVFYRWWVQKEAVSKATGKGMGLGLAGSNVATHLYTHFIKPDLIFSLCILKEKKAG
jgi:4'-phosphopantetheinyl transferase